jgi:hypothetical protein
MIPTGLKVGDTFIEGNSTYEVTAVLPGAYESKRIKIDVGNSYAYEEAMAKKPEPIKKEVKAEPKEDAPAKLDSFNKYTKTEINRLNNAELEKVCDKLGLEKGTGMAMKKAIIEKLGL